MFKFNLPGFSNRLLVRRNAVLSNLLPPLNAVRTKQYIDLAKPKSGACIFFSRTSQGHNALPRPGLEPGSSDSEPSALTTGLLNKAVALACPRYSWPRMLKVAPCTVVRSYIQIFSAWWVTTILYNYGATLCELRYKYIYFACLGQRYIQIKKESCTRKINEKHFTLCRKHISVTLQSILVFN